MVGVLSWLCEEHIASNTRNRVYSTTQIRQLTNTPSCIQTVNHTTAETQYLSFISYIYISIYIYIARVYTLNGRFTYSKTVSFQLVWCMLYYIVYIYIYFIVHWIRANKSLCFIIWDPPAGSPFRSNWFGHDFWR